MGPTLSPPCSSVVRAVLALDHTGAAGLTDGTHTAMASSPAGEFPHNALIVSQSTKSVMVTWGLA